MINNSSKSNDLKEQCKLFMSEQGLPLDGQLITDGKIYRYSADGKKSKPDEWYIGHAGTFENGNEYLVCVFGSWSLDTKYEYKSFRQESQLSNDENIELRAILSSHRAKVDKELRLSFERAAIQAQDFWQKHSDLAPSEEYVQYAKLKGINPIGGIKYGLNLQGYPSMVIPITNVSGEIRSLQYISLGKDGRSYKNFLIGGEKRGNFHIIGDIDINSENIFVVEGYATAVSVYEATNTPTVIAFDAGNLEAVVSNIKEKYHQIAITIAADSDDVGMKKAHDVGNKFGCLIVCPIFPEDVSKTKLYTDFNDLHKFYGIGTVKAQLQFNLAENNLKKIADTYLSNKEEPCDVFKLSRLPVPLREYISIICKTTNAHPIMVTSSVLTMVSAFIGTKAYIADGEYFQNLYPNLWILCIAKSGQFKTTALNKGAKISYDKQAEIFKSIKEIQNTIESAQLEIAVLNKSRENVVLPTKLTAEAFLEYLSEGHQGAVYAGEFGGWLQNLDKSHNNDFKAILTEFYDVPLNYRYKTKTQGDCIIEKPYISICGVSTMDWIRNNLKPSDVPSGFFARFLIFVPPYQDAIPPAFPSPVQDFYLKEEVKFKELLNKIIQALGEGRPFHLTPEARDMIIRFHDHIYVVPQKYSEKAAEILQPYLKRWSPYLIKLSMIMQLFINPETDQVSDVAVLSAVTILLAAIKSTASLFEGELGESVHQRKCRLIFEWMCKKIKETGKPIRRHTIISSKKLDGGSEEYNYVLKTLIEQGKIGYSEYKKQNEWEYYLIEGTEKS